MKTIELTFDGYWLKDSENGIPSKSGIYCVYTCKYNENMNKFYIYELLYIGESSNVKDRIKNHDRLEDWEKEMKEGETLCYTFSPVSESDRERAEAALIYYHKPKLNSEYKNSFPYCDTKIELSGKARMLTPSFEVKRSN